MIVVPIQFEPVELFPFADFEHSAKQVTQSDLTLHEFIRIRETKEPSKNVVVLEYRPTSGAFAFIDGLRDNRGRCDVGCVQCPHYLGCQVGAVVVTPCKPLHRGGRYHVVAYDPNSLQPLGDVRVDCPRQSGIPFYCAEHREYYLRKRASMLQNDYRRDGVRQFDEWGNQLLTAHTDETITFAEPMFQSRSCVESITNAYRFSNWELHRVLFKNKGKQNAEKLRQQSG